MFKMNVLQDFIYTYYPDHHDLRGVVQQRVQELGGANVQIPGGPSFHLLRHIIGWRAALYIKSLIFRLRSATANGYFGLK